MCQEDSRDNERGAIVLSLYFRTDEMSDRKAVIKNADMSEEMQQDAVDCATQALEKYNIEKVYVHFVCLISMYARMCTQDDNLCTSDACIPRRMELEIVQDVIGAHVDVLNDISLLYCLVKAFASNMINSQENFVLHQLFEYYRRLRNTCRKLSSTIAFLLCFTSKSIEPSCLMSFFLPCRF